MSESAENASGAAAPPEPQLPEREFSSLVSQTTIAKNAFYNPVFNASAIFDTETTREPYSVVDAGAEARQADKALVEPPSFAALTTALREHRAVVLVGPPCGKRTAALAALRRTGHEPVMEVAAGPPLATLAEYLPGIASKRGTRVGVLVDGVDQANLAELSDFDLRRVLDSLPPQGALVLTATEATLTTRLLAVVEAEPPDPSALLEQLLPADGDVRERALAALDGIAPPVAPDTIVRLADAARAADSAEELIALFAADAAETQLQKWLGSGRDAEALATLTAAAALERSPLTDVDEAGAALARLLEPPPPADKVPARRFGGAPRAWPDGIVVLERDTFRTHFGAQTTDVLRFQPPHSREATLSFLWRRLGPDFRRALLDWLASLGDHPVNTVRIDAAVTVGLLFTEDPIFIERDVLRPWALSDDPVTRWRTALALGIPIAFDLDPAPARALARSWSRSDNRRLTSVAIDAYGGLLGAWDPGAAAPEQLWRIGRRHPETLAEDADEALAELMVAGADAARVRWTALTMLDDQSRNRGSSPRVHRVLGLMLQALTRSNRDATASLGALHRRETQSFDVLARLLAHAFVASPRSRVIARNGLDRLLAAIAAGRADRDIAVRLIRAMKETTDPHNRAELGASVQRALERAHSRGRVRSGVRERQADLATSLRDQFF